MIFAIGKLGEPTRIWAEPIREVAEIQARKDEVVIEGYVDGDGGYHPTTMPPAGSAA